MKKIWNVLFFIWILLFYLWFIVLIHELWHKFFWYLIWYEWEIEIHNFFWFNFSEVQNYWWVFKTITVKNQEVDDFWLFLFYFWWIIFEFFFALILSLITYFFFKNKEKTFLNEYLRNTLFVFFVISFISSFYFNIVNDKIKNDWTYIKELIFKK